MVSDTNASQPLQELFMIYGVKGFGQIYKGGSTVQFGVEGIEDIVEDFYCSSLTPVSLNGSQIDFRRVCYRCLGS